MTYDDANGLTDNPHVLWWNAPARRWDHGMPIGSGRLGVMVIGRLGQEELHLNEETIWSRELVDRTNPDARAALDEVRALLRAGKPQHAMAIASSRMMGAPNRLSPYQPLGSLIVRLPLEQGDRVEDYVRWLDMQRGIAGVRYRIGDVTYQRELFASAVDDVIVARFSASKPGSITANLSMEREVDAIWSTRAPDRAELEGQAGRNGVRFAAITQVRTDGGQLTCPASAVQVEGAQAMTVLIACGTDFHGKDPRQQAETALAGAISRTYEELRDRHTSDHRRLYDRVELTLADSDAGAHDALPTDQRLGRVVEGGEDAGLAAKLFQFGRYLLISSSRPGNLPANLQGIWNHLITPPWKCDYHLNINLQMNYWPAEVCNLSECHTPLFDWLDRIVPSGQHTAEVHYGCRGFVAHHISDPWDFTVPGDSARCGLWPMGGAWCALHAWEHFAYTQDLEFLRRQGWPLLREAAAFFLDFLVEDEQGRLLCGPSSSPENRYRMADGTVGFLCMGPAMDSQILHELFTACRDAATALNEADELVDRISDARDRLPQPRIGKHGQIMEWLEDYDEPEPGHRHVSQLFAVYPGHQIKVHTTPELAKAATATLDRRLAHGGGHTGWSIGWMINLFARLHDRQRAHDALLQMLRKSTLPSLLDTHPPFQIDGNFGATAGIAEMLLQSDADSLHLLPCLPESWTHGSVRGLVARGGIEVDIAWIGGRITEATLRPRFAVERQLILPTGVTVASIMDATSGQAVAPAAADDRYHLTGGRTYTLRVT